jgi:hypothetical protein
MATDTTTSSAAAIAGLTSAALASSRPGARGRGGSGAGGAGPCSGAAAVVAVLATLCSKSGALPLLLFTRVLVPVECLDAMPTRARGRSALVAPVVTLCRALGPTLRPEQHVALVTLAQPCQFVALWGTAQGLFCVYVCGCMRVRMGARVCTTHHVSPWSVVYRPPDSCFCVCLHSSSLEGEEATQLSVASNGCSLMAGLAVATVPVGDLDSDPDVVVATISSCCGIQPLPLHPAQSSSMVLDSLLLNSRYRAGSTRHLVRRGRRIGGR